jgi:Ca2+/H+ antiporter
MVVACRISTSSSVSFSLAPCCKYSLSWCPGDCPYLGLNAKDEILLALTLLLSVITLGTGRTTVLQGIIHPVFFAVFLCFAVVPWRVPCRIEPAWRDEK